MRLVLKRFCLQALMIAVTQHWGANGFQEHCIHMQQVYQHRANVMHKAAATVCCTISFDCCMLPLLFACAMATTAIAGKANILVTGSSVAVHQAS